MKKASFHLPPLDPAVEAIMRDWRKTGRNPTYHLPKTFLELGANISLDIAARNLLFPET